MKKETQLIQAGKNSFNNSGSVTEPIYKTSTVLFPTLKSYMEANSDKFLYKHNFNAISPDYGYGISGTPTTFALQEAVAKIEDAKYSLLYPSGLSSITSTLLSLLKSGDHILITDSVYNPVKRFHKEVLKRLNIEATYYDPNISEDIESLIQDNTKIIFIETPGSLTFEIQDVSKITSVAKKKNIITMTDNSWATGIFFKPLEYGIDIAIQAGTKYIGGHSDIFLGIATMNSLEIFEKLSKGYKNLGTNISPDSCYLALRGIKTLYTRLKVYESNALKLAKWLENRPEIHMVLHPALESSKSHTLWKKYFTGSGGLFSIVLDKNYSFEAISDMIDNYKIFRIGASWGGYESLATPFNLASSRTITDLEHNKSYIRLYTGLENIDDIIADIEEGFKRLKKYR